MYVIFVGRMDGKLCWRQSKNKPTVANIDGWQLEHVAQESAVGLRVGAVDNRMRASFTIAASGLVLEMTECAPLIMGYLAFRSASILGARLFGLSRLKERASPS